MMIALVLIHEETYWGGWWHRAEWPLELQWWARLRRAGPRGCTTACFHGCHRRTRARSACWCCSGWGSRCRRSRQAGSTCSSHAGWSLLAVSGYLQCCLRKHSQLVNDTFITGYISYMKELHLLHFFSFSPFTDGLERQLKWPPSFHLKLSIMWCKTTEVQLVCSVTRSHSAHVSVHKAEGGSFRPVSSRAVTPVCSTAWANICACDGWHFHCLLCTKR